MSTLGLQEHQVIAVHHFAAVVVAERRLAAVAAEAADTHDPLRAAVGDAAGHAAGRPRGDAGAAEQLRVGLHRLAAADAALSVAECDILAVAADAPAVAAGGDG